MDVITWLSLCFGEVSKGQVGEVYAFDLLSIGVASADDLSIW